MTTYLVGLGFAGQLCSPLFLFLFLSFFFFFGKPTTLLAVLENEGLKAKPRLESSVPFLLLFPHSQVREYSIAGLAVKFVLIPLLPNIP